MLNHKTVFTNQFQEGFVEDSIPASLIQFICNIEHGVDIKSHLINGVFKSDIAIAQLLQYNCKPKGRGGTAGQKHSKDYDTPFAVYMALLVWGQALKQKPEMTSLSDWGWVKEDEGWKIFWTPLPPIAKSCWELTKCGCTKACTGKCKCFRYGLTCTGLCSCFC